MTAPTPFVTTIAIDPGEAVFRLILRADPVVAPLMLTSTCVDADVIDELVIVKVKSLFAGIETAVNVALPDLPLTITGKDAVPEVEGELRSKPFPEEEETKFPLVAVTAPEDAVIVVPAVSDPVTEGEELKIGSELVTPVSTVPDIPTAVVPNGNVPLPTTTP